MADSIVDLNTLDKESCGRLICAERQAHNFVERPVRDRRSVSGIIRRREQRATVGKTIVQLINAKAAEGVWPVGISAMRSLKQICPQHESPMWLALLELDRLDLSLESIMLEPVFASFCPRQQRDGIIEVGEARSIPCALVH